MAETKWSGRRDLNPGPLAPQLGQINHLQACLYENTRVSRLRFGPSLVPVRESFGVSTQIGPCSMAIHIAMTNGIPRAFARTRAVVSAF